MARVVQQARKPYQTVRKLMAEVGLAEPLLELLPRRWTKLGRVALIKLPEALRMWSGRVGGAYAFALGVETVGQVTGVYGELRLPRLRLYYGNRTDTEVREHGLSYRLDVAKVMWSPGNVGWRAGLGEQADQRVAALYTLDPPPETVVDMFAGVGYFALHLARQYPSAQVVAVEKNPEAYAYLLENIGLNRLANVVPLCCDCRKLEPPEGGAQLIHMGYLGNTADYLPAACALLSAEGGTVIFHENYPNTWLGRTKRSQWQGLAPPETLQKELGALISATGFHLGDLKTAKVKSYSPGVVHLVARLEIYP